MTVSHVTPHSPPDIPLKRPSFCTRSAKIAGAIFAYIGFAATATGIALFCATHLWMPIALASSALLMVVGTIIHIVAKVLEGAPPPAKIPPPTTAAPKPIEEKKEQLSEAKAAPPKRKGIRKRVEAFFLARQKIRVKSAVANLIPEEGLSFDPKTREKIRRIGPLITKEDLERACQSLEAFRETSKVITLRWHDEKTAGPDELTTSQVVLLAEIIRNSFQETFFSAIKSAEPKKTQERGPIQIQLLGAALILGLRLDITEWLLSLTDKYPKNLIRVRKRSV